MITGNVPETLRPALGAMSNELLNDLLDQVADPGRIMFAPDYWQCYTDDRHVSVGAQATSHRVDVIKKTNLADGGGPMRQCTRCGSCTESAPGKDIASAWLMHISRYCICGGAWIGVEADV